MTNKHIQESRNPVESQRLPSPKEAERLNGQAIGLPIPPMCACTEDHIVNQGEQVLIERMNGEKITGIINGFSSDKGFINIVHGDCAKPEKMSMHEIKIMHLPKIRRWILDGNLVSSQGDGMQLPSGRLEFDIEFTDRTHQEGKTFGFRNDRYGIHLFPTEDEQNYSHFFIPNSAITTHRIGKQLGQQLVTDEAANYQDVAMVLLAQQEDRARYLGEQLKMNAVVTAKQLEHAVELQKKKPHMQLGEILIEEKLITKEQLDAALEEQRRSRSIPLGAMLVSNGVVSSTELQRSLAAKLGVPFVDLRRFPLRPSVMGFIQPDFAKAYRVIPLHLYEKKLAVAMENPTNWEIVNKLQDETQLLIEPVMATQSDLNWALDFFYKEKNTGNKQRRNLKAVKRSIQPDTQASETGGTAPRHPVRAPTSRTETASAAAPVTTAPAASTQAMPAEVNISSGKELTDHELDQYVRNLLVNTAEQGVTNIHLESLSDGSTKVHIRKDGELLDHSTIQPSLSSQVINKIRTLARLATSDAGPQLGNISNAFIGNSALKVSVATLPTAGDTVDLVIKLSQSAKPENLDKLGFTDINLKCLTDLIQRPRGLILVCGPMGSGKTTTLMSILNQLDAKRKKIWMLDPSGGAAPEGVREIRVNANAGSAIAATLDVTLNADPDIVMIGDLSDRQVAHKAIEAALNGRLIISSLHVDASVKAIERLINMGFPPYEVADAVSGILTQRLTKKLCQHCRKRYETSPEELRTLASEYNTELTMLDSNLKQNKLFLEKTIARWAEVYTSHGENLCLYQAVGCDHCGQTGYKGRIALHEMLKMTDKLRRTIMESPSFMPLLRAALGEGMMTLRQDGIEKMFQGQTDIIQVRAACSR